MKDILRFRMTLAMLSFIAIGVARTGEYSSNPATDINSVDSIALTEEENGRVRLIRNTKVVLMGKDKGEEAPKDSIEKLLAQFYVDQFRNSQDPESPFFTLMSRNANYALGVGGAGILDLWYDWNGTLPNGEFNVYEIQMHKSPTDKRRIGATGAYSKLFLNFMGKNTPVGTFRAYLEASFDGYRYNGFRLRRAWFQIRDFTIGLAKSTFSDPAAQPDLLDPYGANGSIDRANYLVRYLHSWKNHWFVGGSVEIAPSSIREVAGQTAALALDMPDFAALGQYQWNRGLSHVRLSSIIRRIGYRNEIEGKNHYVAGWGTELSAIINVGRVATFYGLSSVGKGIGSYSNGLASGEYDLLPNPGRPGEMYAPLIFGATAGVKFHIIPKLTMTAGASILRNFAKEGTTDSTYKYGEYLAVNMVYNISSRLHTGVEYLAGKRKNYNGESGNINRMSALFVFFF